MHFLAPEEWLGILVGFAYDARSLTPETGTRSHDHSMTLDRPRSRSMGFLDNDGESWACFLVTFRDRAQRWHGYFSFRSKDGGSEADGVRTADIFLEASESEIDQKARGLGRPLLNGLLASALHTQDQSDTTQLRRWFRKMLAENSLELSGPLGEMQDGVGDHVELTQLRSLYASYRLDQVAHFIALLKPEDFEDAVGNILEGRVIDFSAKDRLQFAMLVVEYIESRLPLPPFEVWAKDYVANRNEYLLYSHTLHREGRLP